MDNLEIHVLGSLQVERNGRPIIDFKTDSARALLGLLATQQGMQRRDVLATRLAPTGKTDAAALKYLRLALTRLRNALHDRESEPPYLLINRKEIGLADHVQIDLLLFERLLSEVAQHTHRDAVSCSSCLTKLTEAAALYRGDMLAGLNFDSPDWQAWLREMRVQKQQQAIDVLTTLAKWRHRQAMRGQGEWRLALDAAQRVLHIEAWHEQAHRWVMEAQWQMGQVGAALAQYDACVIALEDELGSEPSEETVTLFRRIEAFGEVDSAEIDTPHNLPQTRTGFFGRQHELTQLQTMLTDPFYRLVSVVGEGGMGKSRLAQEVGWQLRPSYPDGVWFVGLAGVETSDGIISAIAQALDFTFRQGSPPLKQLLRFLRKANLLLILDNFEQLVDETGVLVEILNAASGVVLLCTSRKMLNLQEEIVLPLRGLEVETRKRNQTLDVMQPAIQLFAARARRSDARFVLDDENAETVEQIALLLEGNPLGLELAASWARSRTAAQILAAIEDSADFLAAADGADVDRRHHTMRAVFETSWQMLSPVEQALYPKLTLFRGGFSLEASEVIAAATIEDLDLLIEKSMVQFDRGRYHIHELLRQFADTRLLTRIPVELSFVAFFADYLETNGKLLPTREMKRAMQRITLEEANVKQAWTMAIKQQSSSLIMMADHLTSFYVDVGRTIEGVSMLEQVIAALGEDVPIDIHLFYLSIANDKFSLSEIEQQLRMLGEKAPSALASRLLGRTLWRVGKASEAVGILQQAIELAQQENNTHAAMTALHDLGIAIQFSTGDDETTRRSFARSLELARANGAVNMEARLLVDMGQLYEQMSQPEKALAYCESGLRLAREVEAVQTISLALDLLGGLATKLKKYVQAVRYVEEGLKLSRQLEDEYICHDLETEMGSILSQQGQLVRGEFYLQRAFAFARKQDYNVNESFIAKLLGKAAYTRGQHAAARAYCDTALQKVGDDIRFEAEIRFVLGNTLIEARQLADAKVQFEQAIEGNRAMGRTHREIEGLAGLAELHKRQGRIADARAAATTVTAYIDSGESLFGCEDDLHILWRLYVVLGESRWLEQAHGLLMERAVQFGDNTPEREAYLNNLPIHRQILAAYQAASTVSG